MYTITFCTKRARRWHGGTADYAILKKLAHRRDRNNARRACHAISRGADADQAFRRYEIGGLLTGWDIV